MKNLIKLTFVILVSIYMSGCGAAPKPPKSLNPFKTETLYVYIDETHTQKEEIGKLFKEEFMKPTENYNMKVVVLENIEKLPSEGMLLELSNIRVGYYSFWGLRRALLVDYSLTSLKTKTILEIRDIGSTTKIYSFPSLVENITVSSKTLASRFNTDRIDVKRMVKTVDGKCVENCRYIKSLKK